MSTTRTEASRARARIRIEPGAKRVRAFYDEKVDVYLDGVRQERPTTKFS